MAEDEGGQMNKANIDFCCACGAWIAANDGTIRTGQDGEPEIICSACLALESGRAVSIGHNNYNGSLDSTVEVSGAYIGS